MSWWHRHPREVVLTDEELDWFAGRFDRLEDILDGRPHFRLTIGPFRQKKGFEKMPVPAVTAVMDWTQEGDFNAIVDVKSDGSTSPDTNPVTYVSSNPGLVTAVSPDSTGDPNGAVIAAVTGQTGSATITFTDSTGVSGTIDVTVNAPPVAVEGLSGTFGNLRAHP